MIKISGDGKTLRIITENQSLNVCGQSANITTYSDGRSDFEFTNIPKEMLDAYAEMYIKKHFEISDDGWVRKKATDGNQ